MSEQPRRDLPVAADNEHHCKSRDFGFTCTRRLGHEGDHAAHGIDDNGIDDNIPLYTWPQDGAQ